MKIDLFKLNNLNQLDFNGELIFDQEYLDKTDIRNIKDAYVDGVIKISYEDDILINANLKAMLVLPCAITLEDVLYSIDIEIEENIGKFDDFYQKNKNTLDILPFLWENIVSEVPIRVVKEGIDFSNIRGEGWELVE